MPNVYEIEISADNLSATLLDISRRETVCMLDSCGVSHLGSHLLIAGISPVETLEITGNNPEETLKIFDGKISQTDLASIFTISYDFGLKLENITPRKKEYPISSEPDIFLALFDCLIIHDYNTSKTFLTGNKNKYIEIESLLQNSLGSPDSPDSPNSLHSPNSPVISNFTRDKYLETIEKIWERIRRGDTYQTNLTQQLRAKLPETLTPQKIFRHLRKNHPVPFAAFLKRKHDYVISASPERFFRVESHKSHKSHESRVESRESRIERAAFEDQTAESAVNFDFSSDSRLSTLDSRLISTSPIKGTRPRGKTVEEDANLRDELLNSEKDRAENVMIVDLLRNDIGRICKFGTVEIEKLCDLEEHPTFFHLVSTVKGELLEDIKVSDIIKAVFPCGSITGAPKIRTMSIIDELETAGRGLSMGAIGYSVNGENLREQGFERDNVLLSDIPFVMDLSVAIRTMVVKNGEAIFNVGGGIVIDSIPEDEYEETLIKAKALLRAINGRFIF